MTATQASEFTFAKAERSRVPLRMAIGGPSGSGKTYTSLLVARAISGSKRVALLDTEHGSSQLYADEFDFDVLPLDPPYTPERYRLGIRAAAQAGFGVLIIDSGTHEWSGQGGVLEMVDEAKRRSRNDFAAWAVPSAEHTRFIETILYAPLHVIVTMREKMAYVIDQEAGKRSEVRKVGLQPLQREGTEYEFSIFAEMDLANMLTVTKSRYLRLQGKVFPKPGEEFVGLLTDEIERGVELNGSAAKSEGEAPGATAEAPPASASPPDQAADGERPNPSSSAASNVRGGGRSSKGKAASAPGPADTSVEDRGATSPPEHKGQEATQSAAPGKAPSPEPSAEPCEKFIGRDTNGKCERCGFYEEGHRGQGRLA